MANNTELFLDIFKLGHQNYFLDRIFIFGANELIVVAFVIAFLLIVLGSPNERRAFLFLILGLVFAEGLVQITHVFYFEPRPYVTLNLVPLIKHIPDASFPSEHTTIAATLTFSYFLSKSRFTVLFAIIMLWVGFSRVFVGVHYPLDVLGGIIYGFITAFISSKIINKFLNI